MAEKTATAPTPPPIERPQFGVLTAADVSTLAGKLVLLEAHVAKLEAALTEALERIAELKAAGGE